MRLGDERGEGLIFPVVSRSGFLALSQEKERLRLAWEDVMLKNALFLWNQNPEFSRFHFPQSKSHLAFIRMSFAYQPSPSSIRAAQFVSLRSLSVGCVWGPPVHITMEETRANSRTLRASQEHKVENILFRSVCITTFLYTCSGHTHSGQ